MQVNRVIYTVVTLVVGLALMPIIADSVDALTGTGMTYENTTTGSIINLLPTIVVIGLLLFSIWRKN